MYVWIRKHSVVSSTYLVPLKRAFYWKNQELLRTENSSVVNISQTTRIVTKPVAGSSTHMILVILINIWKLRIALMRFFRRSTDKMFTILSKSGSKSE